MASRALVRNQALYRFNPLQEGINPEPKSIIKIKFPCIEELDYFIEKLSEDGLHDAVVVSNDDSLEMIVNLMHLMDPTEKNKFLKWIRRKCSRKSNKWKLNYLSVVQIEFPQRRDVWAHYFALKTYFLKKLETNLENLSQKIQKNTENKTEEGDRMEKIQTVVTNFEAKSASYEEDLKRASAELKRAQIKYKFTLRNNLLEGVKKEIDETHLTLQNLYAKLAQCEMEKTSMTDLHDEKIALLEQDLLNSVSSFKNKADAVKNQLREYFGSKNDAIDIEKVNKKLEKDIETIKAFTTQEKEKLNQSYIKKLLALEKKCQNFLTRIERFKNKLEKSKVEFTYALQLHVESWKEYRSAKSKSKRIMKKLTDLNEKKQTLKAQLSEMKFVRKPSERVANRKEMMDTVLEEILLYCNKKGAMVNERAIEQILGKKALIHWHRWIGQRQSCHYNSVWTIRTYTS